MKKPLSALITSPLLPYVATHVHIFPHPVEASPSMPVSSPLSGTTIPQPPVVTDPSPTSHEYNASLHEPNPIIFTGTALPSTAICMDALRDPNSVMAEHRDLVKESTVTKLALRYQCLGVQSLYWTVWNRVPRGSCDCLNYR